MIVISRTPIRISFFGGGTDYRDYFSLHKGAVLGTTIDKYTYVSINTISSFFDHKIRIGYSKTELVKSPCDIQHPSIRECLIFQKIDDYLDIHIFADLPAKTGLGSSSSFTVGFLNALYALKGTKVDTQRLAEEACFVEQQLIKENVGSQDQFHAAFGGLNLIEFQEKAITVRPITITKEKLKTLEEHLLLFYTGITRHASEIVKEQIKKTKKRENDENLSQMLSMVYEAEKILYHYEGNELIQKFAELLDQSWELKKQLSDKIANTKINTYYEKAMQAGAYGGKLCGAGEGGFLAFFAPKDKHGAIRKTLSDLLEVDVHFESEGSQIIYLKN